MMCGEKKRKRKSMLFDIINLHLHVLFKCTVRFQVDSDVNVIARSLCVRAFVRTDLFLLNAGLKAL